MSFFQIEVQNSAGAKAQVESRYPGAYNITLIRCHHLRRPSRRPASSSTRRSVAVCALPWKDAKRTRYCDIGDSIAFLIFMTAGSLGSTRYQRFRIAYVLHEALRRVDL
jgi:hypothetical protein